MRILLTVEQIKTILRLRREGLMQRKICERTRLSKFLVSRELKRAGVPMYRAIVVDRETEEKIFRLLGQNHGQPFIARTLGLRPHVVQTIMLRRGYQKPRFSYGCKYHLSEIELRNIRRAIRESEAAIAKRFNVSHSWLRQFRRTMWDCAGERHWKRRRRTTAAGVDSFAALANEAVTRYQHQIADERLSRIDRAGILCESTMQSFPYLRNAAPDVKKYFRAGLLAALRMRLDADGGWVN